ncbi:zinc knuckle [Ancylostoma caninum]|uniref:Zinc knuckle n=1 Tax=Ancylostoma caninum TaxID=29170 RepID=A0A368FJA4_ANCCA|nr:zinc knuckle [Ancylostoma caninum]
MEEDESRARVDLVASISSQVAEGIGPIISELVAKKFKEEKQTEAAHQAVPKVPTLQHPGLNQQAILLSRWIADLERIESAPTEEDRRNLLGDLKKNLRRRLATVVGADSDPSVFKLADAYERVESAIDQTDDFGKAVADHLKKSVNLSTSSQRKRKRGDQPFRAGGYPEGTDVSAGSPFQFPHFQYAWNPPSALPGAPFTSAGSGQTPFYQYAPARTFGRSQGYPQRPCFNCGQFGHIAAVCGVPKKPTNW